MFYSKVLLLNNKKVHSRQRWRLGYETKSVKICTELKETVNKKFKHFCC